MGYGRGYYNYIQVKKKKARAKNENFNMLYTEKASSEVAFYLIQGNIA